MNQLPTEAIVTFAAAANGKNYFFPTEIRSDTVGWQETNLRLLLPMLQSPEKVDYSSDFIVAS